MSSKLSPEVLSMIADRFRILAEPARLLILTVLLEGERTVGDLVDVTGLGQANVSKHLGLLRSSGFVERRKEGLHAWYRVSDPSVPELCDLMCARLEARADEHSTLLTRQNS
jgi:DNA-binding transcriptional ArsR family regulator